VQVSRLNSQTIALTDLDLFCCELLQLITSSAQIDDPLVRERFYSSPTNGTEPEFEMDWVEYVQPDLRQIFQSALEVVDGDLESFPPDEPEESYTLPLPLSHLDAWIHALNQARLALAVRHKFTELEMERATLLEGDQRALSLFQVHFYGFLIECFLRELEEPA
jgi:hypothetical protein